MNFEQLCRRVAQFQEEHDSLDFNQELKTMEKRLQRAQDVLSSQMESNSAFITFWRQKSEEERLEMIQKTCQWLGLMKGSGWCGIAAEEWQFQSQLFLSLCHEFCSDTELITHLEDYCFETHDEQFVKQTLKSFHLIKSDNENEEWILDLITILATFKRFISYFILNGLLTMYIALFKAKMIKKQQEESIDQTVYHNTNYNRLQSSYKMEESRKKQAQKKTINSVR